MAKRYHVVAAERKQLEEEPLVSRRGGNLKKTRAGACRSKDSETMLPPMAPYCAFSGRLSACGWSVCSCAAGDGASAWDVRYFGCELEVQCTIFPLFPQKGYRHQHTSCGQYKGSPMGSGEETLQCLGPKAKDAQLWMLLWEEVHRIHQEGVRLEVEHVNAHRSKKEKQDMRLFERFVT